MGTTSIELERTYLLTALPKELDGVTPKHMVDIYIPDHGVEHPHLRLRKKDDLYVITKKYPVVDGDAMHQVEETIKLDINEYNALKKSSTAKVEKLRYNVIMDSYPAEVDVFQGKLKGLVMVDFEFKDENHLANFTKPKEALVEVSNVDFLAGGLLAGKSYEDIRQRLAEFGYEPVELQ